MRGSTPSSAPQAAPLAPRPITGPTAVVHDWFQGFHGAERVVEALVSEVFAERPDVYTFHAARELLPPHLAAAIVAESRLARLPGVRQRGHDPGRWRYLLPYMPLYFRSLPLEGYETVLASSHSCAVQARPPGDALYICYCYTPMRYAWMPATERGRLRGAQGAALGALAGGFRRLDRRAAQRPDAYITLSNAVRERIRRFYGRDAEVIHPPVEIDEFDPTRPKDREHFLWVGRLVAYKRPDLVIEAFRGLPYRLTIVGVGPLEQELRANLPPNVAIRSWLSRGELVALHAEAGGFLHVAEEDFGISMVEALASGTPVVALQRGGALDIVREDADGVLLDEATVESVRNAVREVARTSWDAAELARGAERFSRARFVERMRGHLHELRAS